MRVVRADAGHITDAIAWMVKRGQPEPPRDIFPPTGWVVPGVAAWWLYLTDSTLAWTEMLVGNPDVSKEMRREGLDLVIAHVLREAKAAGTRLLVCNVDRGDLEERAVKHGYRVLARGQTLLGINLNGGE
ncbi:MAG TPA: hypothetical protein VFV90_12055 [Usitatibacter sp.]|nr:hypothetical protein [Usitatibacter sp.]